MVQTIIKRSDAPLDTRDLQLCQRVFDEIRAAADIPRKSEEGERIAAIVIELFRQGVRNPEHLKLLVQGARGTFPEAAER
ncbi:hypothetical protein FP026_27795 [Rhizobium tropici]|uniref:Uncharacterized protein n=1 Tax=Rhizobium tropici TaxID=398 RepID=A0A5B0VPG3_RHITR|nr:hypothetical protein [Rhizobium tropici]KAA1176642.1 hypothetical protein FP026_27795 [Rhizobium tropici]